jgi:hypothetical protein
MPASSRPTQRDKRGRGWVFDFEHRKLPLLSWPDFIRRMLGSLALGILVVGGSLVFGMVGYQHFEGLGLVDSFINAAMILSGMGPVDRMQSDAGKIFAGIYALYSGLAVLVTAGLILAPLVHRLLHRFHADDNDEPSK